MTIFNVASGEPDSIHRVGYLAAGSTNSTYFDAGMDSAIQSSAYLGDVDFKFGSALGEFWYHQNMYCGSGGSGDTGPLLTFYSATGPELRFRTDGSNNSARMTMRVEITADGSAWTQLGSTFFFSPNLLTKLDVNIKFGTGGFVRIYLNGRLVFSHSATLTSQTNTASFVRLSAGRSALDMRSSEFIVADTNTIGMRMNTLRITGAGTTSQWDNAYTEVDDAAGVIDNTDYIHTATVNDIMTFATENITAATAVTTGRRIALLATTFAAFLPPDATPGDLRCVVRSGTTNYESADKGVPMDGGQWAMTHLWTTDPDTAAAWTSTNINNVEIGVKAVT